MHSSSRGLKVDVSVTRSGTLGTGSFADALIDAHSDEEEEQEEGGGDAAEVSGREDGGVGGVGREGDADVEADAGGEVDVDVEDVNEEVEDALDSRWWVCV